ncbi:MAG TPA: PQQ-binding-like beta-propeller repeat protein [Vicinamibacterales bacterium]|nr:PQQ-binding-like beta-propeller repeat protein [Vicinamibacterales bacterium]
MASIFSSAPAVRTRRLRAASVLLAAALLGALIGRADAQGRGVPAGAHRPHRAAGRSARHARASRAPAAPDSIFPTEQVWQRPLQGVLAAEPGYDDLQAYVPGRDGHLEAYVLVNGKKRWSVDLRTTLPPAAGDHLVFVAVPDAVVALDRDDGHVVWREPVPGRVSAPLTWDTGWLIAGTTDGVLLAWRARDGHLIWQAHVGAALAARASLGGDRVYAPLADGRLVALALETGRPLWTQRFGGPPAQVLPLDSRLFVGAQDKYFYCLNTDNGRVRWQWRTGGAIVGAPVVDEKRVYFASLDNVLRALNRFSGTLQWQQALPIRPTSGPQLVAGDVIVAGMNPLLPAYRAADGTPVGGVQLPGELAAAPHVTPWGFTIGPSLILATGSQSGPPELQAIARAIEPPLVPFTALPGEPLSGY